MESESVYPCLAGKSVFVTGGASGIGAEIVRAFARQGANVGFVDLQEDEGNRLADAIEAEFGKLPLFIRCDISDPVGLDAAIEQVSEKFGRLDVLVNNAADDTRRAFDALTPEEWDRIIAVNLKAAVFAAQGAARRMASNGGSIINFGSISHKLKLTEIVPYNASKAALLGVTRALARELGPSGVRVNLVTPGWVMTERQLRLWVNEEAEAAIDAGQCLKKRLLPRHIADMVLFLASDSAAMCTAQEFVVDGGWS